jgi:REP element-mobilizing transposase RayT
MDDEVLHPGHRSTRLPGYDYSSAGLYFITICTCEKKCILGHVVNERIELSGIGGIARDSWVSIPLHFPGTRLHEFVIMPNHLHGIVEICAKLGRSNAAPLPVSAAQAGSIGAIVRSFKAFVTKQIAAAVGMERGRVATNLFRASIARWAGVLERSTIYFREPVEMEMGS